MTITFTGSETTRNGIVAWQADGSGPEPFGVGHTIPLPSSSLIVRAYQYIASRDYDGIDPLSSGAARGSGAIIGFPNLSAELAANRFTPADLTISFSPFSLGQDIRGQDWSLVSTSDTRFYRGGEIILKLADQPLARISIEKFTLVGNIDPQRPRLSNSNFAISERTQDVQLISTSSTAFQTVGQSLLRDIEGYGIRFSFTLPQPVQSTEFAGDGRFGSFFSIQNVQIETGAVVTQPVLNRLGVEVIDGRRRNDDLVGNNRANLMRGGNGRDRLDGGRRNDLLIGGRGNDILIGGTGQDRLEGDQGRDTLEGDSGRDVLLGNKGRDSLDGGNGNDILVGGFGRDILTGNSGRDRFVYESIRDRGDRITDFEARRDLIDVSQLLGDLNFQAPNPFRRYIRLNQIGSNTVVRVDLSGDLRPNNFIPLATLEDVSANTIRSRNFAF
ncbi:MAG: calcium-binding protein [Elainellaceae cyanobacterium]